MSDVQTLTTEISDAVIRFHKADEMEKKAKEFRKESRDTILKGLEDGVIQAGDLVVGDKKVKVTIPMSKAQLSSFDQTKATELFAFVEDAYSLLLPAFTAQTTQTVNIEVLFALMKAIDTNKDVLIAKVGECIIPGVDSEPLEPRLKATS